MSEYVLCSTHTPTAYIKSLLWEKIIQFQTLQHKNIVPEGNIHPIPHSCYTNILFVVKVVGK